MPDSAECTDDTGDPVAGERPEHDWLAAYVYYHDHLDPLLTEVVAPLTEELLECGLAEEYFFLRYWDGGQHLRLRILPPDGPSRTHVRELVEQRFRRFLRESPATGEIDQESYRRSAEQIARWENESSFSRLRPNNSIAFPRYRRERNRYGYGAAVTAVERHFTESSELALRLVRAKPDPAQRFTAAYSMLVLAWLSYRDDPAWDTSWTGVGNGSAPGSLTDAAELERQWLRQRETLCTLTEKLRSVLACAGGAGDLATWVDSIGRLKRALADEAAAGRFVPPSGAWEGTGTVPRGSSLSVLPVVDICAHLFCNRIGMSVADESYLRQLAMRAIRETEVEGERDAVANDSRLLS